MLGVVAKGAGYPGFGGDCYGQFKFSYLAQRVKRTQIKAGDTGFGYSTVFGPCLDNNVTDATVQDPYIKARHQVIKLSNKAVTMPLGVNVLLGYTHIYGCFRFTIS